MNKIVPSNKIYIARSRINTAGRGVFASTDIKKGELIEACPVLEISEDDTANITEESLVTYLYYFGKKSVIALGCGSIYNHATKPNAIYKENLKEQKIEFWAQKNIEKDTEITVNYSKKSEKHLWFTVCSENE